MVNINETHNGIGDNIAGDKIVSNTSNTKESPSIPVWAQWIGWIIVILGFAWGFYIYMFPR